HDRGGHLLLCGLDRQLVLGLTLAGPVDRERGQAAGQVVLGGGLELLLGGVHAGHHDDDGRVPGRDTQVGGQPGARGGDVHKLGRGGQAGGAPGGGGGAGGGGGRRAARAVAR